MVWAEPTGRQAPSQRAHSRSQVGKREAGALRGLRLAAGTGRRAGAVRGTGHAAGTAAAVAVQVGQAGGSRKGRGGESLARAAMGTGCNTTGVSCESLALAALGSGCNTTARAAGTLTGAGLAVGAAAASGLGASPGKALMLSDGGNDFAQLANFLSAALGFDLKPIAVSHCSCGLSVALRLT